MKAAYVFAAACLLGAVSCERHEWEKTKVLHETHGHDDHHDDHHGEHGDHADHGHEHAEGGEHH